MYSKRLDNTIHDEQAKDEARKVLENQRTMENDRAKEIADLIEKELKANNQTFFPYIKQTLIDKIKEATKDKQDIIDFQTESIKMADKLCREKDEEINELKEVGNKVTDTLEQTFEELQKAKEEIERLKKQIDIHLEIESSNGRTFKALESELKEKTELIERVKILLATIDGCKMVNNSLAKKAAKQMVEIEELLKPKE